MLHRGSDANDNVATVMEIDMNGDLMGQWTAPASGTDQYMFLSSISNRRFMSQSNDGNLLSFNGFARQADGSSQDALFAFDLETRTFDSSTRYTGGGSLRSAITTDGTDFWVSGTSGVNGLRYVEGGTISSGVGTTSSTVARNQTIFYNDRIWISRSGGSTHSVSVLNADPGDFPTTSSSIGFPSLTGIGWDSSDGEYQAIAFLAEDTLLVGTGDNELLTFVQSPGASSITDDWNLLELDVISATGGTVIGVSTLVDPETEEITVFYSTFQGIWRTTYDPNAFDGDKFSTPEPFADDLLGAGEEWGGVVAIVPEPALAWSFGLLSLAVAMVWRRRSAT